jgi:hypothetical protein
VKQDLGSLIFHTYTSIILFTISKQHNIISSDITVHLFLLLHRNNPCNGFSTTSTAHRSGQDELGAGGTCATKGTLRTTRSGRLFRTRGARLNPGTGRPGQSLGSAWLGDVLQVWLRLHALHIRQILDTKLRVTLAQSRAVGHLPRASIGREAHRRCSQPDAGGGWSGHVQWVQGAEHWSRGDRLTVLHSRTHRLHILEGH